MKIQSDTIRTGSVLTASLMIMMSVFGNAMAETAVDEPFSILLFEIGQPGSWELSFTDSLMPLIEAGLSELEGMQVIRRMDPLPSEEEFEILIDSGELDADAAVCMMVYNEDTTVVVYCSYMSISDPADEGDQPYTDQNHIGLKEWPIDPESDKAAALVPLITAFIEISAYAQQGLNDKALETMISMSDYLEETDLNIPNASYHILIARAIFILTDDAAVTLAELDRAIELDSLSSEAYRNRGLILYYSGDIQAAIENATKAISLDSLNCLAVKLRGSIYLIIGDISGTREDLQRFLDSDPSSSYKRRMAEQMLERLN